MIDSSSRSSFEANTGVIEGFFGRPWSFPDRAMIIDFVAHVGWSSYIYAPKEDPYHRLRWSEPYPAPLLHQFHRLVDQAARIGVTFNFALSPGLSIRFSDHSQLELLFAKFDQMIQLGVQSFSILFDDIDPRLSEADARIYRSPVQAQVALTTALWDRIKDRCPQPSLYFCPTQYRGTKTSPYLEYLGVHLPPDIAIFWTGPRVVSPTITADDARRFGRIIKRKPMLWDNYPVNDFDQSRLFLGPLRGRYSDLIPQLSGMFFNPMNQAHASKIALTTAALYVRGPTVYNPKRLWPLLKRSFAKSARADFVFDSFEASMIHPRPSTPCRLVKEQLVRCRRGRKIHRKPLLAVARTLRTIRAADFAPGVTADLALFLENLKTAGRLLSTALSSRPDRTRIARLESKLTVSRRKEARHYLENQILIFTRRLLAKP